VSRILVTGSSGQLGGEICRQLRARGDQVLGLDLAAGPDTGVLGNVNDRRLVAFIASNVTGTLVLLELAA